MSAVGAEPHDRHVETFQRGLFVGEVAAGVVVWESGGEAWEVKLAVLRSYRRARSAPGR